MAPRGASMVQLAPGSLRGAGRCHAKTAQRAESVAVTSHCSVPYVASAFPLRIVQRQMSLEVDVRFQAPESSIYGGYF
jgi:hypothetical protein